MEMRRFAATARPASRGGLQNLLTSRRCCVLGTGLAPRGGMILRLVFRSVSAPALALSGCVALYLGLPWLEQPLGGHGIGVQVEVADGWVFLSMLLLGMGLADPGRDAGL